MLTRRLLSLDYVLEHPRLPWLPTEAEKVAAFEALGIERRVLPQRTYRGAAGNIRCHFHLRLPLALDAGRAVFVYVDPRSRDRDGATRLGRGAPRAMEEAPGSRTQPKSLRNLGNRRDTRKAI